MIGFPSTDHDIERAIRMLSEKMPDAHNLPKPVLLHSIRVGVYLHTHGYDANLVIAGLLHDIVEDTDISLEELAQKFGSEVAKLVRANTKDEHLQKEETYELFLMRCVQTSESAAIVKAADIIDNLAMYRRHNIAEGIDNMLRFGNILLENRPESYQDKIFEELKKLITG